jgi:hypothetical protein
MNQTDYKHKYFIVGFIIGGILFSFHYLFFYPLSIFGLLSRAVIGGEISGLSAQIMHTYYFKQSKNLWRLNLQILMTSLKFMVLLTVIVCGSFLITSLFSNFWSYVGFNRQNWIFEEIVNFIIFQILDMAASICDEDPVKSFMILLGFFQLLVVANSEKISSRIFLEFIKIVFIVLSTVLFYSIMLSLITGISAAYVGGETLFVEYGRQGLIFGRIIGFLIGSLLVVGILTIENTLVFLIYVLCGILGATSISIIINLGFILLSNSNSSAISFIVKISIPIGVSLGIFWGTVLYLYKNLKLYC